MIYWFIQVYLKRTWGQSNNFCVKWYIQKTPKVYIKSQLTYFVCSFACMKSLTERSSLIVQDLATSYVCEKWSKTPWNFVIGGVFSIKVTKTAKKSRGDMFHTFAGVTSHTLNAKLCNFITSWNLIKSPQNFAQRFFSIQLTKIWHKTRDEAVASILL